MDHGTLEALPPHSIADEKACVASLILAAGEQDALVVSGIRAKVRDTDFYQADHQILYRVACEMIDANKPLDIVTLRAELLRRQVLQEIGGSAYLGEVLQSVPTYLHGEAYAETVRNESVKRQLIAVGNSIARRAMSPDKFDGADDQVQAAVRSLAKLAEAGGRCDYQSIGDIVRETVESLDAGGVRMVSTGFDAIDADTGGIGLGEEIIIAARPSMGKSTLLRQIALKAAMKGIPVGFISLEEGKFKIGRNLLAAVGGVENNRIRKGTRMLSVDERQRLATAAVQLADLPFFVSEKARRISDIRMQVATWKARHGIQILIIDYLQRIRGGEGKSKYEQVSSISLEVSDIIKEFEVAGIVAAQLNRGVEGRQDKRPSMSDLRDSGQIEQDADAIVFLHREDYYRVTDPSRQNEPLDETAELIFAKWRDGKRGETVKLKSNLKYQRFEDMPQVQDPFDDPF